MNTNTDLSAGTVYESRRLVPGLRVVQAMKAYSHFIATHGHRPNPRMAINMHVGRGPLDNGPGYLCDRPERNPR